MSKERRNTRRPSITVLSDQMAESPKTTIRWDEGLRADAERCAQARGISLAEFVRQAVAHYVAWTTARDETQNDSNPQR